MIWLYNMQQFPDNFLINLQFKFNQLEEIEGVRENHTERWRERERERERERDNTNRQTNQSIPACPYPGRGHQARRATEDVSDCFVIWFASKRQNVIQTNRKGLFPRISHLPRQKFERKVKEHTA